MAYTPVHWKNWAHVTKLDPDRHLGAKDIEAVASSGTDALMLSGTLNITRENMQELLLQVKDYGLPLVVEPAGPEAVLFEDVDFVFVPSVMNTTDVRWLVGKHHRWVMEQAITWEKVVPEAYIVLNPESSVGKVTKSVCSLQAEEVAAFTTVADQYFRFPVVYLEYSGIYGDPAVVQAASRAIDNALLYYGGGINTPEKAAEMAKYADTIVVGNAIYEQGVDVLRATVQAVS